MMNYAMHYTLVKNTVDIRTSKRKQPVEVKYNLPQMYNANKRRFKPQIATRKRKKMKFNLTCIRKLPLVENSDCHHIC